MIEKPLILITNDDGVNARGIQSLIACLRNEGDIFVVAPDGPRSAQSNAITVNEPVRARKILEEDGLTVFKCSGTPTDCVKLAINKLLPRKPDLLVSGINHGTNASISILYSGTMGAALEGCVNNIPSVGFSHYSVDPRADMTEAMKFSTIIAKQVLQRGLPSGVCLNVNIPDHKEVKGVKVCKQTKGFWTEEFVKREDPHGRDYYWLTGVFKNEELHDENTDEYVLKNGYVSIVPCKIDLTEHSFIETLKTWNYDLEAE
jgi:5'-nucleotidase